jgi:interferon, gamma-inducible protein 30
MKPAALSLALFMLCLGAATSRRSENDIDHSLRPRPIQMLNAAPQKVDVKLYAESLCPGCRQFTNTTVAGAFHAGLSDLFDFIYIAWGNARRLPDGSVSCQHGPVECRLNRAVNCAILQADGDVSNWYPFVHCLESTPVGGVGQQGSGADVVIATCADQAMVNAGKIMACVNGEEGDELERKAEEATAALDPPHQYVPWVTVNGVPIGSDMDNLVTYICAAWQGDR